MVIGYFGNKNEKAQQQAKDFNKLARLKNLLEKNGVDQDSLVAYVQEKTGLGYDVIKGLIGGENKKGTLINIRSKILEAVDQLVKEKNLEKAEKPKEKRPHGRIVNLQLREKENEKILRELLRRKIEGK